MLSNKSESFDEEKDVKIQVLTVAKGNYFEQAELFQGTIHIYLFLINFK